MCDGHLAGDRRQQSMGLISARACFPNETAQCTKTFVLCRLSNVVITIAGLREQAKYRVFIYFEREAIKSDDSNCSLILS